PANLCDIRTKPTTNHQADQRSEPPKPIKDRGRSKIGADQRSGPIKDRGLKKMVEPDGIEPTTS
ncbi:hypothetical protein, partial [Microvirga antarctica]|uniref:hypothetical protein n=1 Tax=Microvirga antarctica TaxID=2819233 RepID=UPI001B312BCE